MASQGMLVLSQLTGAKLENYSKMIVGTLYALSELWDLLGKSKNVMLSANEIIWHVEKMGGHNFSSRGSGGYLGKTSPAELTQAKLGSRRHYLTLTMDNFAVLAPKSADYVVDQLKMQTGSMVKNGKRHMDRQVMMDGTGKLATVDAGATYAAGANITLDHPFGEPFGATQWLRVNDLICFVTTAGLNPRPCQITSIDFANSTIQVDRDVTVTTGDWVVLGDSTGNSYNLECEGFEKIMNTSVAYANLTTTDVVGWAPVSVTKASTPFDWMEVAKVFQAVGYRVAGEMAIDDIKKIRAPQVVSMWHPAMWLKYTESVEPDIEFQSFQAVSKEVVLPTITVQGRKLMCKENLYQNYGDINFVDFSVFCKAELVPWQWDTDSGGMWKNLEGRDARYAFKRWYGNIQAISRAPFGRIRRFAVDKAQVDLIHAQMN